MQAEMQAGMQAQIQAEMQSVLIVNENRFLRSKLSKALGAAGYEVLAAGDIDTSSHLLAAMSPDLVILAADERALGAV